MATARCLHLCLPVRHLAAAAADSGDGLDSGDGGGSDAGVGGSGGLFGGTVGLGETGPALLVGDDRKELAQRAAKALTRAARSSGGGRSGGRGGGRGGGGDDGSGGSGSDNDDDEEDGGLGAYKPPPRPFRFGASDVLARLHLQVSHMSQRLFD